MLVLPVLIALTVRNKTSSSVPLSSFCSLFRSTHRVLFGHTQKTRSGASFNISEENYPSLTGGWSVSPRWAAGVPGEPCDHKNVCDLSSHAHYTPLPSQVIGVLLTVVTSVIIVLVRHLRQKGTAGVSKRALALEVLSAPAATAATAVNAVVVELHATEKEAEQKKKQKKNVEHSA
eukprot:609531-Prorocentrum_minimum.AAC.1